MKRKLPVTLFIFLFLLNAQTFVLGQQPEVKAADVIAAVAAIRSANDTLNIKRAFKKLYQIEEAGLTDPAILKAFDAVESKLNEAEYFDLLTVWWNQLVSLTTAQAQDYAIEVGKRYIDRYQNVTSEYGRYSFLGIMRELRFPFRNSSHIYEGISYFGMLNNRFLAGNDSAKLSIVNNVLAGFYNRLGLADRAVYYNLKSVDFLDDSPLKPLTHRTKILLGKSGQVNRYSVMASFLLSANNPVEAEKYVNKAIAKYQQLDSPLAFGDAPFMYLQLARCKTILDVKNSDPYYQKVLEMIKQYHESPGFSAYFFMEKGVDFMAKGRNDSALFYLQKTIKYRDSLQMPIISVFGELIPCYYLGKILLSNNMPAKALDLLRPEMEQQRANNLRKELVKEYELGALCYRALGRHDSAYEQLNQAITLERKINLEESEARSISYDLEKKMQNDAEIIRVLDGQNAANQKAKLYLFGIVGLLVMLAGGLGLFYRNTRKLNQKLASKNQELAKAINDVKSTQAQLIQSEKMASLGELTAGIAHEIQNPLNFVNNFSEVSTELVDEMCAELDKGAISEAKIIAADIKQNLEKITHHGKRAGSIVRGMLEHSRMSTGIQQPADINALCDEFIRLAYHASMNGVSGQGLMAKDAAFKVTVNKQFDETIMPVNIVLQDIGRVLFNLLNNAFYAVNARLNEVQIKQDVEGYQPTVTITTKQLEKGVEISISDNGNGIPQHLVRKVFQPFFTTKPTGQGTGLGLSLSYDIVKAHGGELKVKTREGEGCNFIISIPNTTPH